MSQQLRDGARAKQLLDDPMLARAFEEVRLGIHNGIASSEFDQQDKREDGYHMLRALESVKGMIERHIRIADGIKAEAKQTDLRTVKRVVESGVEDG